MGNSNEPERKLQKKTLTGRQDQMINCGYMDSPKNGLCSDVIWEGREGVLFLSHV